MGFLQRVLNGGGRITREYAAGRGRMDLFVEYADQGFIIEIKLVKATKGRARTLAEPSLRLHAIAPPWAAPKPRRT